MPGRRVGAAGAGVASDPDGILAEEDPLTPSNPETVMSSGLAGVIGVVGESCTGGNSSVESSSQLSHQG